MFSVPQAIVGDLLRNGSGLFLCGLLGGLAMPVLLFMALQQHGPIDPVEPTYIPMHVALIQINMFVFTAMLITAQRTPSRTSRVYTLPVTTFTLVTWQFFPAMVLAMGNSLLSTLFLNQCFGLNWPLWGPALFAGVATVAIQAVLNQTEKPIWIVSLLTLMAVTLGLWLKSRYGDLFRMPNRYWETVTLSDVGTLFGFTVMSYWAAIVGLARSRRGDDLPSIDWKRYFEGSLQNWGRDARPFRSPFAAHQWFDWRTKGWPMPAASIFVLSMGLMTWLIVDRDPRQLLLGFLGGGGLICVIAVVGGLILGNSGASDTNFAMGHFLATRPMTTPQMANSILITAGKSVLQSWLIWGASFLVVHLAVRFFGAVPEMRIPEAFGWWYWPATFIGPWILVTTLGAICLTGRVQQIILSLLGLFVLFLIGDWSTNHWLTPDMKMILARTVVCIATVAIILAAVMLYLQARRMQLIQTRTAVLAWGGWFLLSVLIALEWMLTRTRPWPFHVFEIGLVALAIAPFASIPLAIGWNRNR